MDELFTIRDAEERDMPNVQYYAALEGMDNLPGTELVRVAVNADDVPVGFCRLQADEQGIYYVNPIVVCAPWRGFGVGRALIEDAVERAGELRLIARGESVGFYERLGFSPMPWNMVDLEAASEDCENCFAREECHPVPMRRE